MSVHKPEKDKYNVSLGKERKGKEKREKRRRGRRIEWNDIKESSP